MPKSYAIYIPEKMSKIVPTWAECKTLVHGVKGVQFKSFTNEPDAKKWLDGLKTNTFANRPLVGSSKNRTPKQAEEARQNVKQRIQDCEDGTLLVFTDGSAKGGNPGYGGAGVYIEQKGQGKPLVELGIPLGNGVTNNVAELQAANYALDEVGKLKHLKKNAVLFTDSIYVCGLFHPESTFQPRANKILVRLIKNKIAQLAESGQTVTFIHVPGHANVAQNEKADQLCDKAARQSQKQYEKKNPSEEKTKFKKPKTDVTVSTETPIPTPTSSATDVPDEVEEEVIVHRKKRKQPPVD